jgi:hypothetical protein
MIGTNNVRFCSPAPNRSVRGSSRAKSLPAVAVPFVVHHVIN